MEGLGRLGDWVNFLGFSALPNRRGKANLQLEPKFESYSTFSLMPEGSIESNWNVS
jgi:hypothetical protein